MSDKSFSEALLTEAVVLKTTISGGAIRVLIYRQVEASRFYVFCASKVRVEVESPIS